MELVACWRNVMLFACICFVGSNWSKIGCKCPNDNGDWAKAKSARDFWALN